MPSCHRPPDPQIHRLPSVKPLKPRPVQGNREKDEGSTSRVKDPASGLEALAPDSPTIEHLQLLACCQGWVPGTTSPAQKAAVEAPHLLSPCKSMVEAGNVGHHGLLIGLWGVHDVWGTAARCLFIGQNQVWGIGSRPHPDRDPLGMGGGGDISHGHQPSATLGPVSSSSPEADHPRAQQLPPQWGEESRVGVHTTWCP